MYAVYNFLKLGKLNKISIVITLFDFAQNGIQLSMIDPAINRVWTCINRLDTLHKSY